MCGAFAVIHPFRELGRPFNAGYQGSFDMPPRYNARPGQKLPVILNNKAKDLQLALWGLKPSWMAGKILINTRKESLESKPFFSRLLQKQRCIIPADAFYEWGTEGGKKVPFLFRLKSKELFGFAGIWLEDGETRLPEFSIITIQPNKVVEPVHDRMPAILPKNQERSWLEANDPDMLINLLQPYPEAEMESFAVSTLVNSPRHDSEEVIKPVK